MFAFVPAFPVSADSSVHLHLSSASSPLWSQPPSSLTRFTPVASCTERSPCFSSYPRPTRYPHRSQSDLKFLPTPFQSSSIQLPCLFSSEQFLLLEMVFISSLIAECLCTCYCLSSPLECRPHERGSLSVLLPSGSILSININERSLPLPQNPSLPFLTLCANHTIFHLEICLPARNLTHPSSLAPRQFPSLTLLSQPGPMFS